MFERVGLIPDVSRSLPVLIAVGESLCTVLTAEDTKVGLAKLVLQTPCVSPVGSEFGGGIGISEVDVQGTPLVKKTMDR